MTIARSSALPGNGWYDGWNRDWGDPWNRDWSRDWGARPQARIARATRAAIRTRRARAVAACATTVTVQLERPLGRVEAARVARAAGVRMGVDPGRLERLLLRRGTRDLTRPIPEALARRVADAFEREGVRVAFAPGAPRSFAEDWGRGRPSLPAMAVTIWGGLTGVVALGWMLLAAPGSLPLF